MAAIQGVSSTAAAAYVAPQAKPEAREQARDEQAELNRGAQEAGEAQARQTGVGTRVNLTA